MVNKNKVLGVSFSYFGCSQSVVSAGLLRIFGVEAAELPLVATSIDCQGQVCLSKYEMFSIKMILFYIYIKRKSVHEWL